MKMKILSLAFFLGVTAFAQNVYDFVGSSCSLGNIGLNIIGQQISLNDTNASAAVKSRCAIIPDGQFQTVGFTTNELATWGSNPGAAPQTFLDKLAQARGLWIVYYSSIINNTSPLSVTGPSSLSCVAGASCAATFTSVGGTAPLTWSVIGGSLPSGLSVNSSGVLSGTVSAATTASITVQVIDATLSTASSPVAITITSANSGNPSSNVSFSDAEVPSGSVNGSNTAFSLANSPAPSASLILSRNGMVMTAGIDFTLSGSTITFLSASVPQTGDGLVAWYRY